MGGEEERDARQQTSWNKNDKETMEYLGSR